MSGATPLFPSWQHADAFFSGHSVAGTNAPLVRGMMRGTPIVGRDTVHTARSPARRISGRAASRRHSLAAGDVLAGIVPKETMAEAAAPRAASECSWPGGLSGDEAALAALAARVLHDFPGPDGSAEDPDSRPPCG